MSSALSLVPTSQKAAKKRRPAFRPGVGPRKKTTKLLNVKKTPAKAPVQEPIQEEAKPDDENENVSPPDTTIVQEEEEPQEKQTRQDTPKAILPKTKRPARRNKITSATSRKDSAVTEAPTQPVPVGTPKKKDVISADAVVAAPIGQTSLSTYCTKFRATKRPTKKNQPVAPPPPLPPEEEEEELAPAGPQVRIVDGEIVLQESSMMVPTARKTVEEVEEEFQHVVEEEGHTTIVGASYNSFVARRKPQHWIVEETKLFYNALRQVGTDFVTMNAFFKNRTRKQLKKKFQRENVKNPHLIQLALHPRNKIPLDMTIFDVDNDTVKAIEVQQEEERKKGPMPVISTVSAVVGPNASVGQQSAGTEDQPVVEEDGIMGGEYHPQPIFDEPIRDDIFGDPFDNLPDVEEFTLEQEMAFEQPPAAAVTLESTIGMATKTKSKRPKFRAGKRKGK